MNKDLIREEDFAYIEYFQFGSRLFIISAKITVSKEMEFTAEVNYDTFIFTISGILPLELQAILLELYNSEEILYFDKKKILPTSLCTAGEDYNIFIKNKHIENQFIDFELTSNIYNLNSFSKEKKVYEDLFTFTDKFDNWIGNLTDPFKNLLEKGIFEFKIETKNRDGRTQ